MSSPVEQRIQRREVWWIYIESLIYPPDKHRPAVVIDASDPVWVTVVYGGSVTPAKHASVAKVISKGESEFQKMELEVTTYFRANSVNLVKRGCFKKRLGEVSRAALIDFDEIVERCHVPHRQHLVPPGSPNPCTSCQNGKMRQRRKKLIVSDKGDEIEVDISGVWCDSCDEGSASRQGEVEIEAARTRIVARRNRSQ